MDARRTVVCPLLLVSPIIAMTDGNYGYTPDNHGTHDLGMSVDLGLSQYVSGTNQNNASEPLTLDAASLKQILVDPADPAKGTQYSNIPDKAAYDAGQWSYANALYLSGLLSKGNNSKGVNYQQDALRDFLSLYAVTQKDSITGNGSWEELKITGSQNAAKKDQIRAALFGSGNQAKGLISFTLIGGHGGNNPYKNIREVLSRLGVNNKNQNPHQSHFHIATRPPELLPIGGNQPSNLLVEGTQPQLAATETLASTLQAGTETLLDYIDASISCEEQIVFTVDIPYAPAQETPIVLVQAMSAKPIVGEVKFEKAFREKCQDVESVLEKGSAPHAQNVLVTLPLVLEHLGYRWDAAKGDYNVPPNVQAVIKSGVFEGPKHGRLTLTDAKYHLYLYEAEPGYLGPDRVAFWVEINGKRFKVVQNIVVVETVQDAYSYPAGCRELKINIE